MHCRSRSVGGAGGGEDPGTADTLHSSEGVPEKRNIILASVRVTCSLLGVGPSEKDIGVSEEGQAQEQQQGQLSACDCDRVTVCDSDRSRGPPVDHSRTWSLQAYRAPSDSRFAESGKMV